MPYQQTGLFVRVFDTYDLLKNELFVRIFDTYALSTKLIICAFIRYCALSKAFHTDSL